MAFKLNAKHIAEFALAPVGHVIYSCRRSGLFGLVAIYRNSHLYREIPG